jgi:hypothetical protein
MYDEDYRDYGNDYDYGQVVNVGPDRMWLPPIAAHQIRALQYRQAGHGRRPVEYCPNDSSRLVPYVGVFRCSCGYRLAWTLAE